MKTPPYPLIHADRWARSIRASLASLPGVVRIEIAGSIRRQCPLVNDIDLVIQTRHGADIALVAARIKQNARQVNVLTTRTVIVLLDGVQLDVWFAEPEQSGELIPQPPNWASVLLCRTGSRHFNAWFAWRARCRGLHWNPHRGIIQPSASTPAEDGAPVKGEVIPAETEEEMFALLGLTYIPPSCRENQYLDWDGTIPASAEKGVTER